MDWCSTVTCFPAATSSQGVGERPGARGGPAQGARGATDAGGFAPRVRPQARREGRRCIWSSPEDWRELGDPLSEWIEEVSDGLAYATRAAVTLLDIDNIVIDGAIPAQVRREIVKATRRKLAKVLAQRPRRPRLRTRWNALHLVLRTPPHLPAEAGREAGDTHRGSGRHCDRPPHEHRPQREQDVHFQSRPLAHHGSRPHLTGGVPQRRHDGGPGVGRVPPLSPRMPGNHDRAALLAPSRILRYDDADSLGGPQ